MTEIFVGRQPIYNRQRQLVAYELLYRPTQANVSNVVDGDLATSEVIVHALESIGLHRLVGPYPALINVTRNVILGSALRALPPGQVILEVLEDVTVDDELLAALKALAADGYRIALDDFVLIEAARPLVALAEIVKLDVLFTPQEQLQEWVPQLRAQGVKTLLAEKIESAAQHEFCRTLGFDYYQGHLFAQPKLVRGHSLPMARLAALQLISALNDPHATVAQIEQIIATDVSLSYKLLRYLNSAFFNLPRKIDSLRRAVIYLGLDNVRTWATLIAMARLDEQRHDLINTALVRAAMCRSLAEQQNIVYPERAFLAGLLSCLDALLETPMEQVLKSLPLAKELGDALLHRRGPYGLVLKCALAYERGDWPAVQRCALPDEQVRDAYLAALAYAAEAGRHLAS